VRGPWWADDPITRFPPAPRPYSRAQHARAASSRSRSRPCRPRTTCPSRPLTRRRIRSHGVTRLLGQRDCGVPGLLEAGAQRVRRMAGGPCCKRRKQGACLVATPGILFDVTADCRWMTSSPICLAVCARLRAADCGDSGLMCTSPALTISSDSAGQVVRRRRDLTETSLCHCLRLGRRRLEPLDRRQAFVYVGAGW
jgi:hypothetical protein